MDVVTINITLKLLDLYIYIYRERERERERERFSSTKKYIYYHSTINYFLIIIRVEI